MPNKNLSLGIIGALLIVAFLNFYNGAYHESHPHMVDFSDFVHAVEDNRVKSVVIRGENIKGHYSNGKLFSSHVPFQDQDLVGRLMRHKVRIRSYPPEESSPTLLQIFVAWAPMIVLGLMWFFFIKQMHQGAGRAMGFGRSKARLLKKKIPVTFEDVAGIDEAKEEIREIVDFLKDPKKFQKLGAKIPRGALLVGPPGTGKTLLVRAVAGESDTPFFSISGSDFVEMFVGVGASRVRDMFREAKASVEESEKGSCIIFIDEIDAVGRHRGHSINGTSDEREQTLNQLLVEMDGMQPNDATIVIAATNRPDVLDPALLRPGRFDRQVTVGYPDLKGRLSILKVHTRKICLGDDIDLQSIAKGTPGFSGADLANLVNEAALTAGCQGADFVQHTHFEHAKDKIMMGPERRSTILSEEEKRTTAYHEAGHAIVAFYSEHSDPIHKVTIIPRGHALGMVIRLPEKDKVSVSYQKLMTDLAVAMGGRVAEEILLGKDSVTTGASSDFKTATDIARRMVTEWGMSESLGLLTYPVSSSPFSESATVSPNTVALIDQEIRRIVDTAYQKAHNILGTYRDHLDVLAQALLKQETLTGREVQELLDQQSVKKPLARRKKTQGKKAKLSIPEVLNSMAFV